MGHVGVLKDRRNGAAHPLEIDFERRLFVDKVKNNFFLSFNHILNPKGIKCAYE